MKTNWLITIAILIGVVMAIIAGIYTYNNGGISQTNIIIKDELAEKENKQDIQLNQTIETSSNNYRVSPNAVLIEKKYYRECDHLIREVNNVPEELVNNTEEEIKEKYLGWKIESYSPTEIILYKEYDGFCDEHYVAKEHNGYIGIYTINSQGVEKLKEDTEISIQYLPEEDIERLKVGVQLIGRKNLYNFLEDYE